MKNLALALLLSITTLSATVANATGNKPDTTPVKTTAQQVPNVEVKMLKGNTASSMKLAISNPDNKKLTVRVVTEDKKATVYKEATDASSIFQTFDFSNTISNKFTVLITDGITTYAQKILLGN